MSNAGMAWDDDDSFWRERPADRRAAVAKHLARIGISLDTTDKLQSPLDAPKPEQYGPPLPDWWLWRGDMLMMSPSGLVVSIELYRKIGGQWPLPAPRAPLTPGAAVDGETASIEEQFR